ncbi:MAG TPA: ATP-binding protein [Candidatus Limnocylindrales bacterium]
MSSLNWRVQQRHPAAIVTLAGPIEPGPVGDVADVLRECLAGMPTVLLLEVSRLEAESCSALEWLRDLSAAAATWPGVPVYLCAPSEELKRCDLPGYASVEEGLRAWVDVEPEERYSVALPAIPQSCADAREFVAKVCQGWGIRRPVRLAQILISELVSNAVMHARSGLDVTVRRFGGGIELSVRDDGAGLILADLPPDPRGFGLQLVEAMSDAWGSAPTGAGKVVWARLVA